MINQPVCPAKTRLSLTSKTGQQIQAGVKIKTLIIFNTYIPNENSTLGC